jgi:hypothetical protein
MCLAVQGSLFDRSKMTHQSSGRFLELPQSDTKGLESTQIPYCNRANFRWKHKDRTRCEKPVSRSLHQSLAPVADLGLKRGDLHRGLQRQRTKVIRIPIWPRNENEVRSAKSVHSEFTSARQPVVLRSASNLAGHPKLFKRAQEVRFAPLSRRSRRQVFPRIMGAELESLDWQGGGHFVDFARQYWFTRGFGNAPWLLKRGCHIGSAAPRQIWLPGGRAHDLPGSLRGYTRPNAPECRPRTRGSAPVRFGQLSGFRDDTRGTQRRVEFLRTQVPEPRNKGLHRPARALGRAPRRLYIPNAHGRSSSLPQHAMGTHGRLGSLGNGGLGFGHGDSGFGGKKVAEAGEHRALILHEIHAAHSPSASLLAIEIPDTTIA